MRVISVVEIHILGHLGAETLVFGRERFCLRDTPSNTSPITSRATASYLTLSAQRPFTTSWRCRLRLARLKLSTRRSSRTSLPSATFNLLIPLVYDKDVRWSFVRVSTCTRWGRSTPVPSRSTRCSLERSSAHIARVSSVGNRRLRWRPKLQMHASTVQRGKDSLLHSADSSQNETLRTRTIYELVFSRIVQYSKQYQVIRSMTLNEWQGEAFASVQLPREATSEGFVAQPIFIDSLLHAAGFIINSHVGNGDAYICSQVDSSKVLADLDYSAAFEIHCTTSNVADGVVLADAWGGSVRRVEQGRRARQANALHSPPHIWPSEVAVSFRRWIAAIDLFNPIGQVTRSPFRFSPRPNIQSSPYTPATATAVNSPADVEGEVMKVIADACGLPLDEIDSSSNIADLGVDSLIWIEVDRALKGLHGR